MTGHPDIIELEALSTGEGDPAVAEHARRCPACEAILADLRQLRSELKALAPPAPAVPEAIDGRILWAARKRALEIRRAQRPARRRFGWAAAVAALLVGALATVLQLSRDDRPPVDVAQRASRTPQAELAGDLDRSGTVDILDAFALARALERGDSPGVDLTGDGRTDAADVDRLARRAVALGNAS